MHIASQAGHPDTTLVFLKKGVPLHMPNKVNRVYPLLKIQTKFYLVMRQGLIPS